MGIMIIVLAGNVILHPNGIQHIKKVAQNKSWWLYWIIFALYLITIFYSNDLSRAWFAVQMKLPFLILPIVFYSTPKVTSRDLKNVLALFIITTVVVSVVALIEFYQDQSGITESLKAGGSMILPISHPRFSLLVAIALLSSIYLFIQKHTVWFKWEQAIWLLLATFLFIFLHILAVRSGLFSFYIASFLLILVSLIKNRKQPVLIGLIAIILCAPILSYLFIPTFKNKINYMQYDLEMLFNKRNIDMPLSDSDRVISILSGIESMKQNPIIGIGIGDINQTTKAIYEEKFPLRKDRIKLPHNQFIYVGVFSGILGLLLFLYFIFFPFFQSTTYNNPIYFGILVILISSFLVEATLETQLGTTIFTFFVMLSQRLSMVKSSSER